MNKRIVPTIFGPFTEDRFHLFRNAYLKNVTLPVFIFEQQKVETKLAKYLVEYLSGIFKS